jgi:hypothetical protein
MNQLGAIPAILIVLAGILVTRNQGPDHAARRLVFVLLGSGVILLASLLVTGRSFTELHRSQFIELSSLLSPSLLGILTLILLNLKAFSQMNRRDRIATILLSSGMLVLGMLILVRFLGGT